MYGTERNRNSCQSIEGKLIEYLDGRARPADRHAVEAHLAGCASCRERAEGFRALWTELEDLPAISPSPEFDALLRQRIAAEPPRRSFWRWIPSPRLAFAVAAIVAFSVWLSSMPKQQPNPSFTSQVSQAARVTAESDFGMIRDLPVLENYDVVSKFDALSELPASTAAPATEANKETRE